VNASGGQPLAGVHVRLMSGLFDGVKDVYGAISDKAGHFSIATIQPGTYLLVPELAGFVYVPPKSEESAVPGLQIKGGQKLEGYKLEMTPVAVLSGRVVDDFGDPVANVSVELAPASAADEPFNMFGARQSTTNDRGEFRVTTSPGKYYLKATFFSGSNEQPEIRTDGTSEVTYGPTFYPSSTGKERATAIEVKAGGETSGLEIRLARQHNLTISGVVTGITDPSARATVMMRFGESADVLNNSRGTAAGPDGRFSFSQLTPGFYRLYAVYSSGPTRLQSGSLDVKLDSADETNVELALNSGGEVTGVLQLEGLPAEKRTVRLESSDLPIFMGLPGAALAGVVESDGSFKIANVPAGKYKLVVEPLPENGFIKTVQLDGATLTGVMLDLSKGARGSRVKIVASGNAAQLSGRVLDKDGQPVQNAMTMVFVMNAPRQIGEEVMTRVGADGTYTKKGIRPGKYHVFALDIFRTRLPRMLQPNDSKESFLPGEEIEFKEGDKIVKDLKILEKEEANGKQ